MKTRITAVLVALTLLAASPAQSDEPSKSTLGFDSEAQLLRWLPRHWAVLRVGSWNTMLQPWLPRTVFVTRHLHERDMGNRRIVYATMAVSVSHS